MQITKPMPIYDGLLTLATAEERAAIIKGGPREHLDHNYVFGSDDEWKNARAAHDAIQAIIARIGEDGSLQLTGIDSRLMPPKRDVVDAEVAVTGRLMWDGPSGVQSKLLLDWSNPPIYIINLRIERVEQPLAVPLIMNPSDRLPPGELKDDTARLHRMQLEMNKGLPPKTAARVAARAMPDPPTTEESLISRLVGRFKKRQPK